MDPAQTTYDLKLKRVERQLGRAHAQATLEARE